MTSLVVGPSSPVSALVAGPTVRIAAEATLREAAGVMRQADVSSLLVGVGGQEIVTERDLTAALANGLGPDDLVGLIATRGPVSIDADAPVMTAAHTMATAGVRHLVVIGPGGSTVGVVSLRDVMRVLVKAMDPAVWVTTLAHSEIWLG